MRESFIELQYFETYYYANVIHNILSDPYAYLRGLHEWHEDRQGDLFLRRFPKWSALHSFAGFIIESLVSEQLRGDTIDSLIEDVTRELWIDRAIRFHGSETEGFRSWFAGTGRQLEDATEDDVFDYHQEMRSCGELGDLVTRLANEVFFLLFTNRVLLGRLNDYVSRIVGDLFLDELDPEQRKLMTRDGVVARASIPTWARRAVYYRDRGKCVYCNKDLTGLVAIQSYKHFDHIVPLAQGGINDVTNIQLLCAACNLSKGRKPGGTSSRYEAWYT